MQNSSDYVPGKSLKQYSLTQQQYLLFTFVTKREIYIFFFENEAIMVTTNIKYTCLPNLNSPICVHSLRFTSVYPLHPLDPLSQHTAIVSNLKSLDTQVCYYVLEDYFLKTTDPFICHHSCFQLATTLYFGLLSTTPQKKALKCNGGDSHILAGASQTLLVNTRRMKQDECTLQGQRKGLNN